MKLEKLLIDIALTDQERQIYGAAFGAEYVRATNTSNRNSMSFSPEERIRRFKERCHNVAMRAVNMFRD